MRLLGAILAGGRSSRFGSDKAMATVDGVAMLDRVARVLAAECAAVVVVGRDWPGLARAEDRPGPGLGPLGGLAGALAHAREQGFDAVLTSACDVPALPAGLAALLGSPDALLADQPTIGLWQARHADALLAWMARNERHAIRAWADHVGARRVAFPEIANINTPEELAAFEAANAPFPPGKEA